MPVSLYLRDDGTLMLANGDNALEIHLAPQQMVQLGADLIHCGLQKDERLLPLAAQQIFGIAEPNPNALPTCPTVN